MTELCWWLAHTKAINVLIQAMAVPSLLPSSFKEMLKKNKLFFGDIFLQVYRVIQEQFLSMQIQAGTRTYDPFYATN